MSNENIKNILVHAPNWVGDHTMALPFYLSLRKLFGRARIVLVGRKWVSSLLPGELGFELVTLSKKMPGKEKLQQLQQVDFDLGITLSPSFRSALLLFRAQCRFRIGYRGDYRNLLLRFPVNAKVPSLNENEHRALSYIRLLTPYLGSNLLAEDLLVKALKKRWKFHFDKKETTNVNRLLQKNRLKKNNFWIICPGTVAPSKVYPLDYLAEVIHDFLEKKNRHKIALVGSHIEKPFAEFLIEKLDHHPDLVDLTEQTSLKDLLYIMQQARGVIANDSGVAHLTSITRTPLVTFIGMARRNETLTLNEKKIVLDKALPCSGCKKQKCPRKDFHLECLRTIEPGEVTSAMAKLDKTLS